MRTLIRPTRIVWLVLALLLNLTTSTNCLATAYLNPDTKQVRLTKELSFLKDPVGVMSFEQVRAAQAGGEFEAINGQALTTGLLAGKPIWIHFTLQYPLDDSASWWLLLTPDLLTTLTLYTEQEGGQFKVQQGGNALPFDQREMPAMGGHGFKLGSHPGGMHHYFIRATADIAVRIEATLWQEKSLTEHMTRFSGFVGLYFGALSILAVMAMGRAIRYRQPLDLIYLSYVIGFELFNLTFNGVAQAWRLVDSQPTQRAMMEAGLIIIPLSFVGILRLLITWPQGTTAWLNLGLRIGAGITMAGLVFSAVVFPAYLTEINLAQAILWLLLLSSVGLYGAWRNYPNARLFVGCYLPYVLCGTTLSALRWSQAPLPDTGTRMLILMASSLIHLFTLWFLILSKDAFLERTKREVESQLTTLQSEMSHINLFLSMLGHELNRPLHALAQLIGQTSEPQPTAVGKMSQRQRLSAIHQQIADILETCTERMRQAAVISPEPRSVNLREIIQAITSHFQQRTSLHLIQCEVLYLPTKFECDPKLIGILLNNLVENALIHSPSGGLIWLSGKSIGPDSVEISVSDEGPGIPPSKRENIFNRYFQLNPPGRKKTLGMGLGLYIVRRIAEMHGGTVACESAPGEGATFRVTLRSGA